MQRNQIKDRIIARKRKKAMDKEQKETLEALLNATKVNQFEIFPYTKLSTGKNELKLIVTDVPVVKYAAHYVVFPVICKDGCVICEKAKENPEKYRRSHQWMSYVWNLATEQIEEFSFGVQIANVINTLASNGVDLLDPVKGATLQIIRTGSGLATKYTVVPGTSLSLKENKKFQEQFKTLKPLTKHLEEKTENSDADRALEMEALKGGK
jgi:hypothetical protein